MYIRDNFNHAESKFLFSILRFTVAVDLERGFCSSRALVYLFRTYHSRSRVSLPDRSASLSHTKAPAWNNIWTRGVARPALTSQVSGGLSYVESEQLSRKKQRAVSCFAYLCDLIRLTVECSLTGQAASRTDFFGCEFVGLRVCWLPFALHYVARLKQAVKQSASLPS